MTRQTFYRNLRKYAHLFKWSVASYGVLRGVLKKKFIPKSKKDSLEEFKFCPVTAVYYAKTKEVCECGDYTEAARKIGLDYIVDANSIANAADDEDYDKDYYDGDSRPRIRQTLLKITNVKEKK